MPHQLLAVRARVAEENLRTLGSLVEEMRVVLPGEADAAVDLDAVLRRLHVGIRSSGLGKACECREVGVVFGGGAGGLVGRRSGQFDGERQVRQAMLDALE